MLSKLTKTELELFGFIRNRWYFKRFIEPSPEIPMGEQIHSQQSHQVRKGPVEFGSKLEETKDQHRDQCCPNLDLHGIGTGSHKGLDLKVLFQGFKENLAGKGLARFLGKFPARFQPLPIGTVREVFPQTARPVSFPEKVMGLFGVSSRFHA